ncbi:TetR/AcrR family transcriptional regulator [Sphingobium sp. CCH11-B1]|uniref:TetR/AcrR family transcriptional regulator n=1 Tax=Sphingobium sp. CCH11-B1 TaxID=1768781 RepID=UPI00082EB799|nr:TetR/AcrR family transcriptional regulator [Sphingobium sp. CCH11-B1]
MAARHIRTKAVNRQPPERGARREARRAQLVAAARIAFLAKGFAATTIEDILRLTETSPATLYAHFTSKFALFEAVVQDEAQRIWNRILTVLPAEIYLPVPLGSFIATVLNIVADEEMIGFLRLVIAEYRQYPSIEAIFRKTGPRVQSVISRHFQHCEELVGLSPENAAAIAGIFLSSIANVQLSLLTGFVDPEELPALTDRIARDIRAIIDFGNAPYMQGGQK